MRSESPSRSSERSPPLWAGIARAALETLRPRQWLKNVLVLVPLASVHRFPESELRAAALAFLAFTLCASSIYVLNDLVDAPADRLHPSKRNRPIAAGRLPSALAIGLVPLLLGGALCVGSALDPRVDAVLVVYFLLMAAYSLGLRAVVLLDAFVLALGYALRVAAGAFAVHVLPSSWLLAFCIFLFFSLALIKRYAELELLERRDGPHAEARAYLAQDRELIASLGVSTGGLAALVLALYLSTAHAAAHFHHAAVIWAVCVLLLYWVSYLWLAAHRGRMTDDPLVFATRDPVSLVLVASMGVTAWLAA